MTKHRRQYHKNYAKWYRANGYGKIKIKTRNLLAERAGRLIRRAVEIRKIIKPKLCENCQSSIRLEAHHPNGYEGEHAFEIEWLCRSCHESKHLKYKRRKE